MRTSVQIASVRFSRLLIFGAVGSFCKTVARFSFNIRARLFQALRSNFGHLVRFCAQQRLHWAESWSGGPCTGLIAYKVRSFAKLAPAQTKALTNAGFSLIRGALTLRTLPSPASPSGELVVREQPVALELFAGTGSLSKAFRAVGFRAFAFAPGSSRCLGYDPNH